MEKKKQNITGLAARTRVSVSSLCFLFSTWNYAEF